MSSSSPLGPTVLAFWRALEYLTPAAPNEAGRKTPPHQIHRPRDKEASWDVAEDAHLPWSQGLVNHYVPSAKDVWVFVVTVGYSPVDDAMDELREMLGRDPHQHDAYCVAAWMSRADREGRLAELFSPSLASAVRAQAGVEGWILGIA